MNKDLQAQPNNMRKADISDLKKKLSKEPTWFGMKGNFS